MVQNPVLALPQSAFHQPEHLSDIEAWHGLIPVAFTVIALHRPRVFVELGTHKGDSYSAFCQALESLNEPVRAYAVDTWQGDEHAGYYGDEVFETLRQRHDPRFGHFSRLVRSTFDEAVSHFDDGGIDLLHIDGLHTYEAVRHDFETWLPKMSARGVMLFHDINVRELGFGVWRLWDELVEQYPSKSFAFSHGLGVLAVGEDLPPSMQSWFDATDGQWAVISEQLHALGERVRLSGEAWRLSERVRLLEQQVQQAGAREERCAEQIESLQTWLVERLETIGQNHSHAQKVVAERDTQLATLNERVADLESRLVQAQQMIGQRDARLNAFECSRAYRLLRRVPSLGPNS